METWRERILHFLFPAESDTWLAVLRLGLGLQVILYALSLQNDWNYLLTGAGNGLIGRNLLTITNYTGLDPEVGAGAGQTGSGLINQTDAFGFPTLRTFTFSLSTRF